jgi:hypothetical protein
MTTECGAICALETWRPNTDNSSSYNIQHWEHKIKFQQSFYASIFIKITTADDGETDETISVYSAVSAYYIAIISRSSIKILLYTEIRTHLKPK